MGDKKSWRKSKIERWQDENTELELWRLEQQKKCDEWYSNLPAVKAGRVVCTPWPHYKPPPREISKRSSNDDCWVLVRKPRTKKRLWPEDRRRQPETSSRQELLRQAEGYYGLGPFHGLTRAGLAKHGLAPEPELRLVMTVDGGFQPWGQACAKAKPLKRKEAAVRRPQVKGGNAQGGHLRPDMRDARGIWLQSLKNARGFVDRFAMYGKSDESVIGCEEQYRRSATLRPKRKEAAALSGGPKSREETPKEG